jgi:hypothetical protein
MGKGRSNGYDERRNRDGLERKNKTKDIHGQTECAQQRFAFTHLKPLAEASTFVYSA